MINDIGYVLKIRAWTSIPGTHERVQARATRIGRNLFVE